MGDSARLPRPKRSMVAQKHDKGRGLRGIPDTRSAAPEEHATAASADDSRPGVASYVQCRRRKSHTHRRCQRASAWTPPATAAATVAPSRHWPRLPSALGPVSRIRRPALFSGHTSTPVRHRFVRSKRGGTYRAQPAPENIPPSFCCHCRLPASSIRPLPKPARARACTPCATPCLCLCLCLYTTRLLSTFLITNTPRSWIPTETPPLSHSPRESTAASTPISTPV